MNDWFEAEQHAERAHEFLSLGDADRALREIDAALRINPDHHQWQYERGLALDALGRHDQAAVCFQHALRLGGEHPETLVYLGIALLRAERPQQAIEALARANEIEPDLEAGYCYRIDAWARLDRHDQAETMFYMARQLTETCPRCFDHIAASLAARGDHDRAIWCLERLIELEPDHPDARARLGHAYWQRGEPEQAHDCYLAHLRRHHGDVEAMFAIGVLLRETHRLSEASAKFRQVIELQPEHARAHLQLGELALIADHADAATAHFHRARRCDPDLAGPCLGLARLAWARGDLRAARRLARLDMQQRMRTPHQALDLGHLLIELDMPMPAIPLLTSVIEASGAGPIPPKMRATALLYRGVARLVSGYLDSGIADCRACLRLDPENTLAAHNLVLAHLGTGQLTRAKAWLRRAERIAPFNPRLPELRHRLRRARLSTALTRLGLRRPPRG